MQSEIELLREAEHTNYTVSLQRLGDSSELIQDTVELYQGLFELVAASGVKPKDELVAAGIFLGGCRYQLTVGCLTALRGHVNDSHFYTRRAVEMCAFAFRIKTDPTLGMNWLQAWRNAASYKQFRKDFSTDKLFPGSHPLLDNLFNRYDLSSKLAHSSVYGLGRSFQTETKPGEWQITFSYCDIKDEDASEPIGTLLYIVDTHFGILRVFQEIFDEVIAHDRAKWEIRRNALDAKLAIHKAKWKWALPTT